MPFANTKKAHDEAKRAGIVVDTLSAGCEHGFVFLMNVELKRLAGVSNAPDTRSRLRRLHGK